MKRTRCVRNPTVNHKSVYVSVCHFPYMMFIICVFLCLCFEMFVFSYFCCFVPLFYGLLFVDVVGGGGAVDGGGGGNDVVVVVGGGRSLLWSGC